MSSPFLLVRACALLGFLFMTAGTLVWMQKARAHLPAMPLLLGAGHGVIYYTFYLLYFYHPSLGFTLQTFSNWGAVLIMQIAWTGALIVWDLGTGWFSAGVLPFFFRHWTGGRFAR